MTPTDIEKLPTPLTDAEQEDLGTGIKWVDADFARQLERELADITSKAEKWAKQRDKFADRLEGAAPVSTSGTNWREWRPEPEDIANMKVDDALIRLGQVAYERDLLLARINAVSAIRERK